MNNQVYHEQSDYMVHPHALADQLPTIQETLMDAGFSADEADEIAIILAEHIDQIGWARAGASLVAIVQRVAHKNVQVAGLCRALGVLPESLSDAARACGGKSKQAVHHWQRRMINSLGEWALAAQQNADERDAANARASANAHALATNGWRDTAPHT